MKLTKVDKKRIAVSRKADENGRCILYRVPKDEGRDDGGKWEAAVSDRVNDANRLYSAFFKQDTPFELEMHFRSIVNLTAQVANRDEVRKKLSAYTSYVDAKSNREKKIAWFKYAPTGKRIENVLSLHVRERMHPVWAENPRYEAAAVRVLSCICAGKDYREQIQSLEEGTLADFWSACKESKAVSPRSPYVDSTAELERYFTAILQGMFTQSDRGSGKGNRNRVTRGDVIRDAYIRQDKAAIGQILDEQVAWLKRLEYVGVFEKNRQTNRRELKKIPLSTIRYGYATDARMEAVLVRMRKSLKRGTNGQVAVRLLQGLAGKDGTTLGSVIAQMERDEAQKAELKSFLHAVNKDYFKVNVYVSVKNINVKVQPQENEQLDISGIANVKRQGLQETLVRYAASKGSAETVLSEIKGILFDYFLPGDEAAKKEYTAGEKLWSVPKRVEFFDSGFEVAPEAGREESLVGLEELWDSGQSERKIKARIKYVNYGRYLQLLSGASSEVYRYWIAYIKEFVEETYAAPAERNKPYGKLKREMCFATSMMLDCWKQIIRYLCGKYMDIGKAVYHFAMPEDLAPKNRAEYGVIRPRYAGGLSSFDYEAIKAEETLKRDIAVASVSAISNFTRAVIHSDKHRNLIAEKKNAEDILFLLEEEIGQILKSDAKSQLLRFYGGASAVEGFEVLDTNRLVNETLDQLKSIRNQNFHYTAGKKKELSCDSSRVLWENESRAYRESVLKKYYSNNAPSFYGAKDLISLMETLYREEKTGESQIPAFYSVWKKKDVPAYVNRIKSAAGLTGNPRIMCEGALYFLLKEIYYRGFVVSDKAAELFFKAVRDNETAADKANENSRRKTPQQCAATNFREYVSQLEIRYRRKELSFGNVCQYIQSEYNQQNAKQKEVETYKHFKMLLPICLKMAFEEYVKTNESFRFVLAPVYRELKGEELNTCLNQVKISCAADQLVDGADSAALQDTYAWFTFAHFIDPRQLNLLIGDFKSHIQYREDIWRRKDYADQFEGDEKTLEKEQMDQVLQQAKQIIRVLEFVREGSGRVSNTFSDYYEDENAYAAYLMQYIDAENQPGRTPFEKLRSFCMNTLPNGQVIDIYADTKNPKVLRNVELARMYAGGDTCLGAYGKVNGEDLKRYYREQQAVAAILAKGYCTDENEQRRVLNHQQLSNRITLNDVTNVHSIINEMLGQLVSLSYLRERDEMYLLLGFYYMALNHSADGWGEMLDPEIDDGNYQVKKGLVLYQIMGIFDFGIDLLYFDPKKKRWSEKDGQLTIKLMSFYQTHRDSLIYALKLFGDDKYDRDINGLRNYVDHFKFYTDREKSILDLYNGYYTKMFGYSSKLRKSTLSTFESILERSFVKSTIRFEQRDVIKLEKLESEKFTYKLGEKKNVIRKLPAKSNAFLRALQGNLESRGGK